MTDARLALAALADAARVAKEAEIDLELLQMRLDDTQQRNTWSSNLFHLRSWHWHHGICGLYGVPESCQTQSHASAGRLNVDLVIIYGSESVGKLTVARRLEEKTGFRLFHNHISIEVGRVLFEYGQDEYNDLIWQVRLLVFEAAAKTWCVRHYLHMGVLSPGISAVQGYDLCVPARL